MRIPIEAEPWSEFAQRVILLLADPTTHVYVDTSFLMWMTKIGTTSRSELTTWFISNCGTRVHVPVWAAHEYLQHHVAGTIVGELDARASELKRLAVSSYDYLRPFLDDPIGRSHQSPQTVRAEAFHTLRELGQLAARAVEWKASYAKHAHQVIAFINERTLVNTKLFRYLSTIEGLGTGRFRGRIPPGFQDRHKGSGRSADESETSTRDTLGNNAWGDLILWREVLDHARSVRAAAAIIVTNDRKNDWYFGHDRSQDVGNDLKRLRRSWRPVPAPHPMLSLEAQVAGLSTIELLDGPYLAALAMTYGVADEFQSFVDVAIVGDGLEPLSEKQRREITHQQRLSHDRVEAERGVASIGLAFPDAPNVVSTPASLRKALYLSRQAVTPRVASCIDAAHLLIGERRVSELLKSEAIGQFDHCELVLLTRELHDRSRDQPGYVETVTEVVASLDALPPKTAACLYLGLLASMYLERSSNNPILPPLSAIARYLFAAQNSSFASLPVETLVQRIRKAEQWPIYIPSISLSPIAVEFQIRTGPDGSDELRGLRVNGVELMTPAQGDQQLLFTCLVGNKLTATGGEMAEAACALYGVPSDQLLRTDDFGRSFSFGATAGFKAPRSVYMEDSE